MLRTPLQSLVLNIKSMAPESGTAKETLSLALTPPDENALDLAVQELKDLKAMALVNNTEEIVTPLGKHLTHMPCDPRLGKMLVYASLLGCLDPMLTIASAMSGRPLFYSPKDNREDAEKKKRAFAVGKSDHLAVVNAFDGWLNAKKRGGRGAERRFCDENYLSSQALEAVLQSRVDFAQILSDLGFVSRNYALRVKRFGRAKDDTTNCSYGNKNLGGDGLKDEVDVNSNVSRIIKAALVAGLYPKLVRAQHPVAKYAKTIGGAVEKMASGREMKYYSRDVGRVFLHPTSVNFNVGKYESTWLVYGDRVQTSKVFVRDCTMVGSYPLLLFGGELDVKHEQGKLVLDDWCEFNAPAKIGVLARELRKKIDQLLTNKVNSPGPISMDNSIVKAMLTLIESEGM
jgi:ATP-dependent RNA helicase DHX57